MYNKRKTKKNYEALMAESIFSLGYLSTSCSVYHMEKKLRKKLKKFNIAFKLWRFLISNKRLQTRSNTDYDIGL